MRCFLILFWFTLVAHVPAAEVVSFFGYDDIIQLENDSTRVMLCPAAGGRVLEYSLRGTNALYLNPDEAGWTLDTGKTGQLSAGRFDIGPEKLVPARPTLWLGKWDGEITGQRSARLTSRPDPGTGVQLVRDFQLAEKSTKLVCRQTIKNVSSQDNAWCHWSRTFAQGNGICVIPLSKFSKFPKHYVQYQNGKLIDIQPEDPHIERVDDYLVIRGVPQHPKLGMDSMAGWFAYLMPNDLLFVKSFPTYPERVYNEVMGLSVSIWYPQNRMVELEPIGPREKLQPGEAAAFTETWELHPYSFPKTSQPLDLREIRRLATKSNSIEPNDTK